MEAIRWRDGEWTNELLRVGFQGTMHGRSWHFSTKTPVYARDALGGALGYGERAGVVRTKMVLTAGDWLCPKDTSRFP